MVRVMSGIRHSGAETFKRRFHIRAELCRFSFQARGNLVVPVLGKCLIGLLLSCIELPFHFILDDRSVQDPSRIVAGVRDKHPNAKSYSGKDYGSCKGCHHPGSEECSPNLFKPRNDDRDILWSLFARLVGHFLGKSVQFSSSTNLFFGKVIRRCDMYLQ
jgi:hypothetical protein